jgi:hypothetical protein
MREFTTKRWFLALGAAGLFWPAGKPAAETATMRPQVQLEDFKKIFDEVPKKGSARPNLQNDSKVPLDLCSVNRNLPQCKALRE